MISTMQESTREERARRNIQWSKDKPAWDGTWDYYKHSEPFSGTLSQIQIVDPLQLPPILTRTELIESAFPSVILVQRMATAGWIKPVHQTETGEPLYTREDLYKALDAILQGERPPVPLNEVKREKDEPELGQWVGPKECAAFLNISERTLRHYTQKKIPSYCPGKKHRRYDLTEVKEAIKRRSLGSKWDLL